MVNCASILRSESCKEPIFNSIVWRIVLIKLFVVWLITRYSCRSTQLTMNIRCVIVNPHTEWIKACIVSIKTDMLHNEWSILLGNHVLVEPFIGCGWCLWTLFSSIEMSTAGLPRLLFILYLLYLTKAFYVALYFSYLFYIFLYSYYYFFCFLYFCKECLFHFDSSSHLHYSFCNWSKTCKN